MQDFLNSHFCIKISKMPNSPTRNAGKPTLHSLIAKHVLETSIKLKFQCVRFEKKHCFDLMVLMWFGLLDCFC